ncbi:MAG: hypothetical protein KRP56_06415 [Candidatus Methanogranum gryphiswaldense]|nr:MAG: hypothetical protein KRP56_06415 [Candidatus Methanogranum sp. U3.2.1]
MVDVYNNFLKTISDKFKASFNEIQSDYNFDLGDEFEIAVCKTLNRILPKKYGVCRGTVFTIDGRTCGDDIIIYDQQTFPTLRLLEDDQCAQKQRIPIEAVVAYIEAKNTIVLEDGCGNSLMHAVEQAVKIKTLGRKEHPLDVLNGQIDPIPECLKIERDKRYPQINNPIYTCIFSNGIRKKPKTKILNNVDAIKLMDGMSLKFEEFHPDLLILSNDIFLLPAINGSFCSPFFMEGQSKLHITLEEKMAWGIGISLMFHAFEDIRLKSEWKWTVIKSLELLEEQ